MIFGGSFLSLPEGISKPDHEPSPWQKGRKGCDLNTDPEVLLYLPASALEWLTSAVFLRFTGPTLYVRACPDWYQRFGSMSEWSARLHGFSCARQARRSESFNPAVQGFSHPPLDKNRGRPRTSVHPWHSDSTQWDGGRLLPPKNMTKKPKYRTSGATKRSAATLTGRQAWWLKFVFKGLDYTTPTTMRTDDDKELVYREEGFLVLLITASSSRRSLWWAKYKVMHVQTRCVHPPLNQD